MDTGQMRSMEERLAGIGRHIDQLMRKGDGVGDLDGAANELAVWKRWRDELHLQTRLGAVEARDALKPMLDKLEHAFAAIVNDLDDPTEAIDVDELGVRVSEELGGLRRELESVGADFRIA